MDTTAPRMLIAIFTGQDGNEYRVSCDMGRKRTITPEQATSNAIAAMNKEFGPDFIASYRISTV